MGERKPESALDDVLAQARDAHGDDPKAAGRLQQLEAAVATAKDALIALDDEKMRRDHDRAERVRRAQADDE